MRERGEAGTPPSSERGPAARPERPGAENPRERGEAGTPPSSERGPAARPERPGAENPRERGEAGTPPSSERGPAARPERPGAENPREFVEGLLGGDRRALARAITLVESTRPDHRAEAEELLSAVLPRTGGAMRVGVSGSPGAGKSTFIEALGVHLTDHGHRVAVLAVDPSSSVTGGSILGDKTRMEELTRREAAFIRPSPSRGSLGGVARRTREVLLLCEAAGFDVVLVETVGVGQSEVAVAAMVDLFLLLVAPGGGDELQGIKRGIVELADLVVVNKADGALAGAARVAAAEYAAALHLMRPRTPAWDPRVLSVSSIEGTGIADLWTTVEEFRTTLDAAGVLGVRRAGQLRDWMWSEVIEGLTETIRADAGTRDLLPGLEADVRDGRVAPTVAAHRLLDAFLRR